MCNVRSQVYGEIREVCSVLRRTHTKFETQHGIVREVSVWSSGDNPSDEKKSMARDGARERKREIFVHDAKCATYVRKYTANFVRCAAYFVERTQNLRHDMARFARCVVLRRQLSDE
jgi:hypothetical protein